MSQEAVKEPARKSGVEQTSTQTFKSPCGNIMVVCDSNTPLGDLHDYLMALKGEAIEGMHKSHLNGEATECLPAALFKSPCGKVALAYHNNTRRGALHDYIMAMKGEVVTRMMESQRQEEALQKSQKERAEAKETAEAIK